MSGLYVNRRLARIIHAYSALALMGGIELKNGISGRAHWSAPGNLGSRRSASARATRFARTHGRRGK